MKKWIAALTALLLLVSFSGCQQSETAATKPELQEPVGVKLDTAAVEYGDLCETAYFEGEVVPFVETLYFDASGRLGEIMVTWGDKVKAGQVLATLDQSRIQNSIASLEADIAEEERMARYSDGKAEADITIAEAELEIMRRDGATAEELNVKWIKIQQLKTNLRQTKQLRDLDMAELYAELDELKSELGAPALLAPFDGYVAYVNQIESGKSVNTTTPMFVIADHQRTYIAVSKLSEASVAKAHRMYASVDAKEVDLTRLLPEEHPELDEVFAAAGEAKMLFSYSGEEVLRCGEFAGVVMEGSYVEHVLTLPTNALLRDRTGFYVYKKVDDHRVRCDVKVGMYLDTRAEILEGLQEGDVVYVQA